MYRQTAPGRMESMNSKGMQYFSYQDNLYHDPEDFSLGTQLQEPSIMQGSLLQQLHEHSQLLGQPDSTIYRNTQLTGQYDEQWLPQISPAPISVRTDRFSSPANRSFTFQQTPTPSQPAETLEALFDRAEAAVDQYLDSPHAAMLFGDDATDTLAQLCARLPSTTRRQNPFNTLVQFAVNNPKQPSTPHSGRKRTKHPSSEANPSDGFGRDMLSPTVASPASFPAAYSTGFPRFSSDTGTPSRRRWGLDLSDEGSGASFNRRQSSGDNSPLESPSATGLPAKQPRSSECCVSHNLKASLDLAVPPAPANTPVAAVAPKAPAATTTAGTATNTSSGIGRKIRIKIKGSGGLSNISSSSGARSSCPGGWMPAPSKLGYKSSPAVNAAPQMVLDLSTPPPENPRTQQGFASSGGAGALASRPMARTSFGGGGSTDRRLSGHKHGKETGSEAGRMVSPRISQSTPRKSAGGMLEGVGSPLTAHGAAFSASLAATAGATAAVANSPMALPSADVSAPKRRLKFHVQGLGSTLKQHSQAGTTASRDAGQQYEQPPAAANLYPSFTTWAQAPTAQVPAAIPSFYTPAGVHKPTTTVASAFAAARVQLSPFAAVAAPPQNPSNTPQNPSNNLWRQRQQQEQDCEMFIPTCAAHVGISVTTQSGTGPLTRRVSSQALVYPLGTAGQARTDGIGAVVSPVVGPLAEQQQSVLHLQLPRIRTKSQPLGEAAFPDAFGVATGTSSSSSSAGKLSSSNANTPSSVETATGVPGGTGKPVAGRLLNHIGFMTLQSGNVSSPASCMSTGSAVGVGSPAGPATAAARDVVFDLGGYYVRAPVQQKPQQQQRRSSTGDDDFGVMYAQYCNKRQPVTTSMPVIRPPFAADAEVPFPAASSAGIQQQPWQQQQHQLQCVQPVQLQL